MLKVTNLTIKSREKNDKLLDKVSFEVGENEIHCILGINGSGKSTLAYALLGLDRYEYGSGKIMFLGKDISKKQPFERAKLGLTISFQEPARFEGLTVSDYLKAGKKKATEAEMKHVLNLVGLEAAEFLQRNIDEKLSGGERKRIELASVIIMKPKLMILDEPDASLDIIVYNELYDLMLSVKEELKCSILLITHREEAGLIADRATLISGGKVIESGRFRHVMRVYCEREGRRDRCMAYKMRKKD
jgi:Fe-S cluster assembly ATP-binding protein